MNPISANIRLFLHLVVAIWLGKTAEEM